MPGALGAITGGLYCSGGNNDSTTAFIAATNLVSVASDTKDPTIGHVRFVIVDYPTLSSLSFPDLAVVGSEFIIARNPKLTTIEFPSLKSVTGNVDITGDFQVLELPSLSYVGGNINLQTSFASFMCPLFANTSVVGSYACSVGVNDPQPLVADNSSTNPSPVNVISIANTEPPASATSSIAGSSFVSSTSQVTSSPSSQTSLFTSTSPSLSATPGSASSSASASSMSLSIIVFAISFTQILTVFWM